MIDIIKKLLLGKEVSREDMAWEMWQICDKCSAYECIGCPVSDSIKGDKGKDCPYFKNGNSMLDAYEALLRSKAIAKGEFIKKAENKKKKKKENDKIKYIDSEFDIQEIDFKLSTAVLTHYGPEQGIPAVGKVTKKLNHSQIANLVSYLIMCTIDKRFLDHWLEKRMSYATAKLLNNNRKHKDEEDEDEE